jgi:hypothetical protein
MQDATVIERIRRKFQSLQPVLDERARRQWAAAEALELGYGGASAIATATGMARDTIRAGLRELAYRQDHPDEWPGRGVRRPGGGRKCLTETDPALAAALEALVEPLTRGDPESPLRWTCKSTRKLALELSGQGHAVSYRTVAWLLHEAGYSLQANRKTREGNQHPHRNGQFAYINAQARRFQKARQPVISVDTKKKELVGDFKNVGRVWRPAGEPEAVRIHDFLIPAQGKAVPLRGLRSAAGVRRVGGTQGRGPVVRGPAGCRSPGSTGPENLGMLGKGGRSLSFSRLPETTIWCPQPSDAP